MAEEEVAMEKDLQGEAIGHLLLGVSLAESGASVEGREHLEASLQIFRTVGDRQAEANVRRHLGSLAVLNDAEAIDQLKQSLEIYESLVAESEGRDRDAHRRMEAFVNLLLGKVEARQGNMIAGIAHLTTARVLFHELTDPKGEALTVVTLGQLKFQEDPGTARADLLAAADLYADIGDLPSEAEARGWLGQMHMVLGETDAARDQLGRAIRLFGLLKDRVSEAHARLTLGQVETFDDNHDGARRELEKARALYEDEDHTVGAANARKLLSTLESETPDIDWESSRLFQLDRDNPRQARAKLEIALSMFQATGNRLGEADTHLELASLENLLRNDALEQHHLEEARTIYESNGVKEAFSLATTYWHLFLIFRRRGDVAQASSALKAYVAQAEEAWRVGVETGNEALVGLSLRGLAGVFRVQNLEFALSCGLSSVRALQRWRGSLDYAFRLSLRVHPTFSTFSTACSEALSISATAAREGIEIAGLAALEIIEAARSDALAAVLRAGGQTLTENASGLLEEIAKTETGIAQTFSSQRGILGVGLGRNAGLEAAAEIRTELEARLVALKANLEREVSESFTAAYIPEPIDVSGLLASLEGCHALIYDLDTSDPDRYTGHVVWIPDSGKPRVSSLVIEEDELEFLGRLAAKDPVAREWTQTRPYRDLAVALLPEGLKKVIAETTEDRPLKLVIAPAGPLWALPFAALRIGDEALIRKAVITLTPTLTLRRAIMERPRSAPARRVVAHFHPGLEGARVERNALEGLEAKLGELIEFPGADGIHGALAEKDRCNLATVPAHGDGNGLDQALVLGDGTRLSAAAALTLYFPPVVVLGACWSARLDPIPGREPVALATACLTRGAETVIGGLLAIHDRRSGTILAETYRHIAAGFSAPEALRLAQLAHLDERPGYWAGLSAVGL